MELLTVVLLAILSVLSFVILLLTRNYKYWEARNVPVIKPSGVTGNLQTVGKTEHMAIALQGYYNQLKGKFPYGGLFFSFQPVVLATDLDFIKNVLVKDFNYFNDRGVYFNERTDPISTHVASIHGQKWKTLRTKLTPTFTSGKMKMMFPLMTQVGGHLREHLNQLCKIESDLEIKELVSRYTTDIITTCAFGIESKTVSGENMIFREKGQKVVDESRHSQMVKFMLIAFREYAQLLGVKQVSDDVSEFFKKVTEDTIKYRETNDVHRNDFMQLMLNLKNSNNEEFKLTQDEINAQAFVFFMAGFETSSTLLTFCLYELSVNHDIQAITRDSVNEVFDKGDGKLLYEHLAENHYIEQVLNETLRKYPPVATLFRKAVSDYEVPDTKSVISKGTLICIPNFAIQRDPEFFPEPDKFDPQRFTPENVKARHSCSFLPFGEGPRNCIGLRFGMLQAKICIAMILRNFEISISNKTQVPLVFRPKSTFLSPTGGMWIKLKPVD